MCLPGAFQDQCETHGNEDHKGESEDIQVTQEKWCMLPLCTKKHPAPDSKSVQLVEKNWVERNVEDLEKKKYHLDQR
ncbi:hypothetical protein E2C01_047967 [Portunus trituberculatus]|uniref:Uncharacterized protein n=1 Tax=Portunus trituberculatus TaxID=210409 RepID=A0A5B7G1W8_PORTR|nr:hypothetical protein [Portunus trituberculatus]